MTTSAFHRKRVPVFHSGHEGVCLPFQGVVTRMVRDYHYGIIATVDGLEVYFLRHSVRHGAFDALVPGSRTRFNLAASLIGLQARQVDVVTGSEPFTR